MSSVKLKLTKMLLFVSFGLKYIYYSLILFLGVSESCIICFFLILLAFLFVYLNLFGLNRGLKILFGLFWLPKNPLLPRSDWYIDKRTNVCNILLLTDSIAHSKTILLLQVQKLPLKHLLCLSLSCIRTSGRCNLVIVYLHIWSHE